MSGDQIGPGKVLEGFESLIFEEEETTPRIEPESKPKPIAQSESRSDFKNVNSRQGELTGTRPRTIQGIFRKKIN